MDLTAPMTAAVDAPVPSLFEDCTVTSVNPLRIRRDGDSTDLPFAPDTMIPESLLAVSDRVRVENANGRLIIVGRGTGIPVATTATPDTLILRDGSGRAKVADPSEPDDIDTMGARDAAIAAAIAGLPRAMAAGTVVLTPVAVNAPVSATVTFPAGRFSSTPVVQVSPAASTPQSVRVAWGSASTSGVTIYLTRSDTTLATTISWLATEV